MKKVIVLLAILFVLGFSTSFVMAEYGPAPNSGDGISDGSGMDSPNDPNK